jgi:hypothetical protein
MTGADVATLINEILEPGTYLADWNAVNNASGTYFYKLSTEQFTQVRKLVLVK